MRLYDYIKILLKKSPYMYNLCCHIKDILITKYRLSMPQISEKYCVNSMHDDQFVRINAITPIRCRKTDLLEKRINILVPSINIEHVFGGISTALRLYNKILEKNNVYGRIILTQIPPSAEALAKFPEYNLVQMNDDDKSRTQIVFAGDRANSTIPVGKNDIFLATAWWTAYNAYEIIEWQNKIYGFSHKLIYLIQDYEPGFYAWSTQYALADSTYKRKEKTIAIFNSKELYSFFKMNKYDFCEELYFEPILNSSLKKVAENTKNYPKRKKQILIYGRPSTPRNCYELVVIALQKWSEIQSDAAEWEIFSVGEKHANIRLNNGAKIQSLGKLKLQEYAQIMLESYAGISLMVSPHPSYPPLEMSTFGMKVITNNYKNKNLNCFNSNMHGLEKYGPVDIALELKKICDGYDGKSIIPMFENKQYVDESDEFPFVAQLNI